MTSHLAAVSTEPIAPPATFAAHAVIEQEVDGTVSHEVLLTLTDDDWRTHVADFAAAIASRMGRGILPKLLAAGARPVSIPQQRALDDLVEMLKGPTHPGGTYLLPPTWSLAPESAAVLADQLTEAAADPVVCPCGAVVQQPTQLTTTCGGCVDRIGGDR